MPEHDQSAGSGARYFYFFLGFLALSLVVRLLLINWYSAPYTDGVFLMTLFETYNYNNSYPPLYSALLYSLNFIFHNPVMSGRLISIISGVGIISGAYYFGKKFFNQETGFYAALIYGTAPIVFRWDLRVMTDSLFALFFLGAIFFLYRELTARGRFNFLFFNLCAVLSSLTRYQGLVFFPITLVWFYQYMKSQEKNWPGMISGSFLWFSIPGWMILRGFSHAQHYKEFLTARGSFWLTLGKFITVAEMFIPALVYAFGYLAFALMVYVIYRYHKNEAVSKWFLAVLAYLFFAFWMAHSAFLVAFQTRYFLPFWPFAALFTALGVIHLGLTYPRLAKTILIVIVSANLFWSGMVLYFQKDSFGALRRSAQFVKRNLPNEIMAVAEDYKFTCFSGRYRKGQPFNKRFRIYSLGSIVPPVGSYIYVDTLYSKDFNRYVNNKSKYRIIYTDSETVMPILPDVVSDIRYVNSPEWLAVRFRPQVLYSAILKVVAK